MKFKIVIDIEVSKTIAETIQRSGFSVCPDGNGMQVRVGNAPPIPKRKTMITFENPKTDEPVVSR